MKHIAKNRPRRLATALASLASSVRRTIVGRPSGRAGPRPSRTNLGCGTRSMRATNLTSVESKGDAAPTQVAASSYVFGVSSASRGAVPLGFALFKSMGGLGLELWLTAVDPR